MIHLSFFRDLFLLYQSVGCLIYRTFDIEDHWKTIMLGAKYDFSRDRERRAGVDDMVGSSNTRYHSQLYSSGVHV